LRSGDFGHVVSPNNCAAPTTVQFQKKSPRVGRHRGVSAQAKNSAGALGNYYDVVVHA
jgi:hypothetical protein